MSETTKLKLKLFEENDYVDFEDINDNSRKIDDAYNWKMLNNTYYTGHQTNAIALPENFTELTIKVNINPSVTPSANVINKILVIREELYDNDAQQYRAGYFYNTDSQTGRAQGGCASFLISKSSINLDHAYLNENVVTSNTTWTVYYR